MKEIERIIDKFTLNKPYLYKVDRKKLSELLEQYVIKARIEVAKNAPYLVIDGEVVSKHRYIAGLKKEIDDENCKG